MVERSAVNRLVVGSNPTAPANMVEWRNGSRNGLKIRWDNSRVGSSPTSTTNFGDVAQWSERAAHNRLVGGSNPSVPTSFVSVAQWIAQMVSTHKVGGSSPSRYAKY